MRNQNKKIKVLLALSGGVDSSVALLLLKQAGYDVKAAFMKNWSNDEDNNHEMCNWKKDRLDALKVATKLDVPFITIDFEKEYREKVFNYMVTEYAKAKTPNPDVMCNKEIKFGLLLKYALENGFDKIATGHYAQIKTSEEDNQNIFHLYKGLDPNKDQSYFLSSLTQEQLKYILFPIGEYRKDKIREIAKENDLITANKKDSQGICFVGKVDMKTFLSSKIKPQKGEIRLLDNTVIGNHNGVMFYTIGQRKGLGIGGGKPFYVVKRDLDENILWVTDDKNDSRLYQSEIIIKDIHWLSYKNTKYPYNCQAKIRYRQNDQKVTIFKEKDHYNCVFQSHNGLLALGK